ncbi:MAG: ABC transporter ATP-binding protein [Terriglobales bacterium]
MNPTLLSVRDVRKRFGAREVLRGVSLDVAEGEFLTVLGESGSGKTTLLRLIAGFERTDAGEIVMSGERIEQLPPYQRPVNTVFQQYALFPHMSVAENVAYGMRVTKVAKAEAMDRAAKALAQVKMTEFADASPSKLSGGQQQRVALARALVNRPKLLLLDEPLSALDANLRRQMQSELKSLQREVGISFIFVTHDQDEAMALSDRIALLRDGVLEQIASPSEIYNRPASAYSAGFIGKTNLIQAQIAQGEAVAGSLRWKTQQPDGPALFSIRPENIRPASGAAQNGSARFAARVQQQMFQGATRVLWLECQDGTKFEARMHSGIKVPADCEFEFDSKDAVLIKQKD